MFVLNIKAALCFLVFLVSLLISPTPLAEQGLPNPKEIVPLLQTSQNPFYTAYNYFQTGAYDKAITAFQQFLAAFPDSPVPHPDDSKRARLPESGERDLDVHEAAFHPPDGGAGAASEGHHPLQSRGEPIWSHPVVRPARRRC